MSAFRAGHSWPAGNGGRAWVSYPLWFAGLSGFGKSLAFLFLWWVWLFPLAAWCIVELLLLTVCFTIIVVRLARRDRFHVVPMRLPFRLVGVGTVTCPVGHP